MNHVCVLLHGVEADPKDRLWSEEVEAKYQQSTSISLMVRKYGYVSSPRVWFSAFQRREVVDHEEAYFRALMTDLGPNGLISVAGHSLGGYITTALLKRGIKFHRVAHLWGSTVADFDWHGPAAYWRSKIEDNFNQVRVYWSPDDEVLTASSVAVGEDPELALGLMGKEGPKIAHPRVESIKEPYGFKLHTQFMDDTPERDKFWEGIFGWMSA